MLLNLLTKCAPCTLARHPPPTPSRTRTPVLLCKLMDKIVAGLIRSGLPHTSRGTFPELENLSAFLSACRKLGVAEHSLFDPKDLHEKRDMQAVVRCLHVLGAAVQSTVPDFNGPFLGKESTQCRPMYLSFIPVLASACDPTLVSFSPSFQLFAIEWVGIGADNVGYTAIRYGP